ncbi:non-homologous end-joining factor 1 isoform X2 [Conger conger]|nr:non-homologous end-joining factor 1 isoform X2 [Conger conger]XP_061082343.1 non-homologous end-joining factor 1 isoform X2 [Conger conger]XP_061082344.1 non-homologous end-joining factor 1 isoform X2 [Conger conger]XP_061082345.1 non-homologous end-joining factor 1 isoform X2 [Conger conger]XP_061082346.1 non-homologous end-joining factor 1 isoform X2 [Conger conger]
MVSVGVSEDLLREQSWVPVCLGGVQLLAKSWFADTAYRLLLSDLQCVWEEEMDAAAIQDRAQDLNKRLRAPVSAFFSHLCTVACPRLTGGGGGELEENVDPAEFSLLRSHDCLEVRLKSELAGVPFYWEFRCTPAAVTVVCRHFVQPLLAVSRVLQRQVGELGALLSRKDAEIQDYKENGAELSRARLKTEVFEEQSYREGFIAQALPQVCAARDELAFDTELQELYTAVTAHRSGRKRKSSDSRAPGDPLPKRQSPPEAPSRSTVPGAELGSAVGQAESRSAGPEPGPGSAEVPQHDQTAPLNQAPSDRPVSRPRKKKALGLFR